MCCPRVGIRTIRYDFDHGFFLNDKNVRMLGVCLHHDMGCLGSAVHRRAIERELTILRGMGVNAIRTSHNPPAPELLELCDEMGFLVMDEAFDMWRKRKTEFDYARFFDKCREWYPDTPLFGSETVSSLNSRGVYFQPSTNIVIEPAQWWLTYDTPHHQCTSYDAIQLAFTQFIFRSMRPCRIP